MFQYSLTRRNGSGSGFGSWKAVPAVPVPLAVSGKTVPTVPVSGSGSVPEPPWTITRLSRLFSRLFADSLGDFVQDVFGISGPEGPQTNLSRGAPKAQRPGNAGILKMQQCCDFY